MGHVALDLRASRALFVELVEPELLVHVESDLERPFVANNDNGPK